MKTHNALMLILITLSTLSGFIIAAQGETQKEINATRRRQNREEKKAEREENLEYKKERRRAKEAQRKEKRKIKDQQHQQRRAEKKAKEEPTPFDPTDVLTASSTHAAHGLEKHIHPENKPRRNDKNKNLHQVDAIKFL